MLVRRCLGDLDGSDRQIPLLTTSDSANLASTGLYLRFGLLPQTSILQLQGLPRPFGRSGVTLRQTDPAMGQDAFDRLDQIVLGGEIRPEDHQCWAMVPSMVPVPCVRTGPYGRLHLHRSRWRAWTSSRRTA